MVICQKALSAKSSNRRGLRRMIFCIILTKVWSEELGVGSE
jgi:hypothetical protein